VKVAGGLDYSSRGLLDVGLSSTAGSDMCDSRTIAIVTAEVAAVATGATRAAKITVAIVRVV